MRGKARKNQSISRELASDGRCSLFAGHANRAWVFSRFILPALIGNVIGGTGLFAMLAHAQVKEEI